MKKLVVKGIFDGVERYTATAYRVSRWISIKTWVNPTPRCQLWEYATDGNGELLQNGRFAPKTGIYIVYFTFNGRNYALQQFARFGSGFLPGHIAYIENGEQHYLHGVDMGDIYNPIYIEVDDYGEKVRVYRMEKGTI